MLLYSSNTGLSELAALYPAVLTHTVESGKATE